jgi:16S rRNA (uracil1498-N3)-methyltransferase
MQPATGSEAVGDRRPAFRLLDTLGVEQRVTPRFFCPPPLASGTEIALPAGAAHHVLRVLRLKPGDALTLFDGEGGEYRGELARASPRAVVARLVEHFDVEREAPFSVTLVQGLAAADRMDYAVQKAVELGVTAIAPVIAVRSVARLEGARATRRAEHWRQIVIAACEQSGRNRLPKVHEPCVLGTWLRAPSPAGLRVLLAPDGLSARSSCWWGPRAVSRRRNQQPRAARDFGRCAWGRASCARSRRERRCLRQ